MVESSDDPDCKASWPEKLKNVSTSWKWLMNYFEERETEFQHYEILKVRYLLTTNNAYNNQILTNCMK